MKLIDVSSNNHSGVLMNWQDVKAAGYDGVYVKATQGTQYTNPYLLMDTRDAKNAGLEVGIYHFYDDTATPDAQAQHFITNGINQVDKGLCSLMPAFDYEIGAPIAQKITEFVNAIPGGAALYCNRSFYSATGLAEAKWCWLAWPDWNGEQLPAGVRMIQTGTTVVPGIPNVQCDIDTAIGEIHSMTITAGPKLAAPIVGALTSDVYPNGYWLAGADGGVFAFGCPEFGTMVGKPHAGIVAIIPSDGGKGYALIAADGGVFAFGDFVFMGSIPGIGIGPA